MKQDGTIKMVAKTSFGLEEVLAKELNDLGIGNTKIGNRAVYFSGNLSDLYNANIWLRTANRIIVPIEEFRISSVEDLYQYTKRIEWEKYFDTNQTFAIDSAVFSKLFNHTKFAALKAKDAIADRFREKFSKRPNIDTENPDIRINLHISQRNEVTMSLDSSGDPLFKRGYRDSRSMAPIKEDLAAGLILLSGWDKKSTFVDLFCGSGTLLIEAAMIAKNIAPNLLRDQFGFENWKNFDKNLLNDLIDKAEKSTVEFDEKIIGVEISGRVLGMARANLNAAGLLKDVELHKKDFKAFKAPSSKGMIVSNPPYGERLTDDIVELYKSFGDNLKAQYNGFDAWIISSNLEALKKVGLRPSRKIKLYNGSLECRFMKYEMYQGTKKVHKITNEE